MHLQQVNPGFEKVLTFFTQCTNLSLSLSPSSPLSLSLQIDFAVCPKEMLSSVGSTILGFAELGSSFTSLHLLLLFLGNSFPL